MKITKKITLDVSRQNPREYVFAKQGDVKSRFLEITLTDNGLLLNVPDAAVTKLQITRADKHPVNNNGSVKDEKIFVELTEQALMIGGEAVAEISVFENDEIVTSQVFYLNVQANVLSGSKNADSESPEVSNDAMLKAEEAVEIANTAKETAEKTAKRLTELQDTIGTLNMVLETKLKGGA